MKLKASDPRKVRKEKPRPVHSVKLHPLIMAEFQDVDLRCVEILEEREGWATQVVVHNQPIR